jgi:diguanylate cyclase (GGDEF)-like protein/PAS domain S-box-containing protein
METGRDANGIKALNRLTLEQIVAASPAPILVADARNARLPVVYVNRAYEQLTGFCLADLAGEPWALLERTTGDDLERLRTAIGRGEAAQAVVTELRKDGTSWTSEVSVTPLHNGRGELKYFLCSQRAAGAKDAAAQSAAAHAERGEVSLLRRELGRARLKIATMDRLDAATGLLRFSHFQETVRRDLAIARRDRRYVSLLVFEIVELDVYQQTFGDKAADSCQRMIGAQIARALRRAGDLCARYDESTLVAAVLGQSASEIQPLADRIADNVSQLKLHNPRGKTSRYVSVRATVVNCPPGAHDDPGPVIARALENVRGLATGPRAIRA